MWINLRNLMQADIRFLNEDRCFLVSRFAMYLNKSMFCVPNLVNAAIVKDFPNFAA